MTVQRKIQLLLWAYFWLLIFEGALRKWFLPGLSNPLLIMRDPICLAILVFGWPYLSRSYWYQWILALYAIGGVAISLAMLGGHRDLPTALFGARILFLHMPLLFLFPLVFGREEVWHFARSTLLIAIPMTILIALQFSLPQSHILNIAPGGEGSAGFGGALDKFRPPGTFSFINGLTDFYALAAAFLVAWLTCGPKPVPRWIWISAAGIIFALPLSISRTLLFSYALVAIMAAMSSALAGRTIRNFALACVLLTALASVVSQSSLFQDAKEAFLFRWDDATWSEGEGEGVSGVLSKRVVGSMLSGLKMAGQVPLSGLGIGLGTNVGAMRAVGSKDFVVAEAAWPTIVGELGPILGLLLILLRVALAYKLVVYALFDARQKNPLPLVLGAVALPALIIGQTSQPTSLGFFVLSVGLMLVACNPSTRPQNSSLEEESEDLNSHA
jgi:hypothetical protein